MNDNNSNVLEVDALTLLNILSYVSYSLFAPFKPDAITLVKKAILDGCTTAEQVSFKIGYQGKDISPTVSKLYNLNIINKNNNQFSFVDSETVAQEIQTCKDTIIKNSSTYTKKDLTSLYNAFGELSSIYFLTQTRKDFSDLVFDFQSSFEILLRSLIKKKTNLTKYLILYYVSMFNGLDHVRLHKLIPGKTVKNIKVVMRSMEINNLICYDDNDKTDRKKVMYITSEGAEELKDVLFYANSSIDRLYDDNPSKAKRIVHAVNTICECGTNHTKRNVMKNRDLFAKETKNLYL